MTRVLTRPVRRARSSSIRINACWDKAGLANFICSNDVNTSNLNSIWQLAVAGQYLQLIKSLIPGVHLEEQLGQHTAGRHRLYGPENKNTYTISQASVQNRPKGNSEPLSPCDGIQKVEGSDNIPLIVTETVCFPGMMVNSWSGPQERICFGRGIGSRHTAVMRISEINTYAHSQIVKHLTVKENFRHSSYYATVYVGILWKHKKNKQKAKFFECTLFNQFTMASFIHLH